MRKSHAIGLKVLLLIAVVVAWLCALVEVTTLVSYRNFFTAGEIFAWITANGYEEGDIISYCLRYVWPYWLLCTIVFGGVGCLVIRLLNQQKTWTAVVACLVAIGILVPMAILPTHANLFHEYLCVKQQIRAIEAHKNENRSFQYNALRTDTQNTQEIYVLAIGESVRYKNFSLNGIYERATTPLLDRQTNVCLYSDYFANATLTQHAMPMLLTSSTATAFRQHYQYKTIAEAFKETGFTTALISHRAQLMNNGYHDYLAQDFDTTIFVTHDSLIAPVIEQLAQRANKLFVVTNYLGNHMFYTNRTEDCLVWRPDYNADSRCKNDSLFLNAYDNSLLYTDRILSGEIETLQKNDVICAWLFISDHGEYIDERVSGHGFSYNPTKDEYHVPLMVWYSDEYQAAYPDKVANMMRHKDAPVCADHIFWSVLDMAGIRIDSTLHQDGMSIFGDTLLPHTRQLLLPDGKSIMTLD